MDVDVQQEQRIIIKFLVAGVASAEIHRVDYLQCLRVILYHVQECLNAHFSAAHYNRRKTF